MGGALSALDGKRTPVVLVPPLFETEKADVERFTRGPFSAEGNFFNGRRLGHLFEDYLREGYFSKVVLSSKENPVATFIAKLGSPASSGESFRGDFTFRVQNAQGNPYSFAAVSLNSQDHAAKLSCCLNAVPGLFMSGSYPISKASGFEDLRVGACYTSRHFTTGLQCNPNSTSGGLPATTCYVAAGTSNIKAACQFQTGGGGSSDSRDRGEGHSWSCGITYSSSPSFQRDNFSCSLLLCDNLEKLDISVYQRMIVKRRVKNPFEAEHVVGITNTIDAGVNIVAPLTKGLFEQTIQMAIQWQVNKNWMFKGKASLDCISMALVAKSWWNPASTISFVIQAGESLKYGFSFNLEHADTSSADYARGSVESMHKTPTMEDDASRVEQESFQDFAGRPKFKREGKDNLDNEVFL